VHRVGDQPRLYYDARSTNHQDYLRSSGFKGMLLKFVKYFETQPVKQFSERPPITTKKVYFHKQPNMFLSPETCWGTPLSLH
jgi:hypothetical protein